MQQLRDWLALGDHGMAEFKAKQIIERQRSFTRTQTHGLPADLQLLVHQAEAEVINYPGRADDVRQMHEWLAKGDHGMAAFKAKQVVERQQVLRLVRDQGMPAGLQLLIEQVDAELIEYSGRAGDTRQMQDCLAKGDHSMAEFRAKQIVERQRQLRSVQEHGLPVGLQALIDQASAERIEYSGRAGDAQQLQNWLAKGDHSMAEFQAKQIVERQQRYRQVQEHGLPAALQLLIDQVNADVVEYTGRTSDMQQLQAWLAGGDHNMAEFKAKQVIERQRNIRSRS